MFPLTTRAIQKQLALVCDYLGYERISIHSFRKWYAAEIYKKNGYDIALVQRLLQHSSAAVTQRYIGIEPQRIEKAIEGHAELYRSTGGEYSPLVYNDTFNMLSKIEKPYKNSGINSKAK